MERLQVREAASNPRPPGGGTRVLPRRRSLPMEHLRGTVAAVGASPPARGTWTPAKEAVAAFGARAGDCSYHRRGLTTSGDRESCPGGVCFVWSAYGGRLPSAARLCSYGDAESCQGGGRYLWSASGRRQPQVPGPGRSEDGESCPGGGICLWSAYRGRQLQSARAHYRRGGESCPGGGWCLWSACRGLQLRSEQANQPRGSGRCLWGAYRGRKLP